MFACWPTVNSIRVEFAVKPCASTLISYVLGNNPRNAYAPSSSLVAFLLVPLARSVIVILAPGIKAPALSVITPRTSAVDPDACAYPLTALTSVINAIIIRFFIMYLMLTLLSCYGNQCGLLPFFGHHFSG